MTSIATEFPAKGKVVRIENGRVVFSPSDTNYELHLSMFPGAVDAPTGVLVEGVIRATARKLLTVPPGGNFVAPIFGTPKTVQGRVRTLDDRTLVIQAGTSFVIELPVEDNALDLNNGSIGVGTLVNVIVQPGASFEFLRAAS